MDIRLTKEIVEKAVRTYMDGHKGRTPSMKAGPIEGVPELDGFTWQMLDTRLGQGLVEGVPAETTFAKFKQKFMGLEMFHGRIRSAEKINGADVVDSVLAFIADKKVRPILTGDKIQHGPFKDKMTWSTLGDVRSRGVNGMPEGTRLQQVISTVLDVLEDFGVEVKGTGLDRGRTKMRLPKYLDKEAVKTKVLSNLMTGIVKGPKETPPPEVDGNKLYMHIMTRVAGPEMEAIAKNPEAEVMGFKVGDLNRAFKAKTVKGAEGYTSGKECNTLLQFEAAAGLLPAGVVVQFDEPEAPAAVPSPQPALV